MSDQSNEVLLTRLGERAERLSRFSARHPVGVDVAVAAATAAVSVLGLVVQSRPHFVLLAFCAGLCLPLLLHRRSPEACFALIAAVALAQWLTVGDELADVAVLIALYWVARSGSLRGLLLASAVAEAGAVAAAVRWAPTQSLRIWVGLSGMVVAAAVLGITVRQQRALLASLKARTATLEFERDQEGRLAAAAERARIAREMHDIVSHNLTVMTALADAATYTLATDPQRAVSALQRVSATGRSALVEMRRLLGVLSDEPSPRPLEPQPTLARLDELITRVEAAGIPVTIEIDGDPHSLSDGVQLAVFRVAQEALTNTLKHATRPTAAHLRLRCRAGVVDLEVIDTATSARDGSERAATPAEPTAIGAGPRERALASVPHAPAGRGIRGMRERATAYGGEIDAGPTADGGWRVHVRLGADGAGTDR